MNIEASVLEVKLAQFIERQRGLSALTHPERLKADGSAPIPTSNAAAMAALEVLAKMWVRDVEVHGPGEPARQVRLDIEAVKTTLDVLRPDLLKLLGHPGEE